MGVVSSPCPPYAWGSAKVVGAWSQRYLGERGTHGPERGWGGAASWLCMGMAHLTLFPFLRRRHVWVITGLRASDLGNGRGSRVPKINFSLLAKGRGPPKAKQCITVDPGPEASSPVPGFFSPPSNHLSSVFQTPVSSLF